MHIDIRREVVEFLCSGCVLRLYESGGGQEFVEFAGAGYSPATPEWTIAVVERKGGERVRASCEHEWLLKQDAPGPALIVRGWRLTRGERVVASGPLDGGPVSVGRLLTQPVRVDCSLEV